MTAPATTERTRAAAGTTPANLEEAPDELKLEGVEVAAVFVPVPVPVPVVGVDTDMGDDMLVAVAKGVEELIEDAEEIEDADEVEVDAAVAEEVVAPPMAKEPL
jgi:hypothetical protein